MSTRCNIIIKNKWDKFFIYRHCDGYPQVAGKDLIKRFKDKINQDYIWITDFVNELVKDKNNDYEITDSVHGDIKYLYTIDMDKKTFEVQEVDAQWKDDEVYQTFHKKQDLLPLVQKLEGETQC